MALTCHDRAYVYVFLNLDGRPLPDYLWEEPHCCRGLHAATLRCMNGGITHEGQPPIVALYSDPSLFCGRDVADTGVGVEKVMMYHHQMYKGRILALESSDGLDVVLELAVQSLVQVAVIELFLQVNVQDTDKPRALLAFMMPNK